ncbi:hypothetical protein KM043_010687 [Ampulex compressa]|nr:hypothetical protein KM043_010687 [Ampulex compressa]
MVLQSNDAYIDKEQIYIGEVQRGGKSLMKECHTIQEDNYKMDFVCWNEQDAGIKYDEKALREDHCEVNDLIPSNELKICIQNFLKRVKQEVFIDLPGFPQTRPLHISPNPLHVVPSEFCKFKTVQQVLRNNDKSSYLVDGIEKPMLLQAPSLTSNSIGSRNMNNTVYRTKSVTTSKPKSQKINQDYIMSTFLQSCDSGRILNKAQTVASFDGKHNAEDLPNRWKEAQREEEFTPNFPQQSTSNTSKLVTCKKKFYDVLLGIQKARGLWWYL